MRIMTVIAIFAALFCASILPSQAQVGTFVFDGSCKFKGTVNYVTSEGHTKLAFKGVPTSNHGLNGVDVDLAGTINGEPLKTHLPMLATNYSESDPNYLEVTLLGTCMLNNKMSMLTLNLKKAKNYGHSDVITWELGIPFAPPLTPVVSPTKKLLASKAVMPEPTREQLQSHNIGGFLASNRLHYTPKPHTATPTTPLTPENEQERAAQFIAGRDAKVLTWKSGVNTDGEPVDFAGSMEITLPIHHAK